MFQCSVKSCSAFVGQNVPHSVSISVSSSGAAALCMVLMASSQRSAFRAFGRVWCGAVRCGVVWCGAVWRGVVRCGAVCAATDQGQEGSEGKPRQGKRVGRIIKQNGGA